MTSTLFQHGHFARPQSLVCGAFACVALTLLYILGLLIYNVFLHPLRQYPGPKLWAGFRLPYVHNQVRGCLPQRVKDLHDQYGPIVRVAPNELSYITASAWKEIYGFRKGQPQNPKDLAAFPAPHKDQAASLIEANDADHSRHRRLLSHAFSARALEEQQSLVIFYVDLLIQRLKDSAAEPQNMVAWYNWTTFDIIGDLAFGESFHGLRDQYWHPWVETIVEGLEAGVVVSAARRYGLDFLLQYLIPKPMLEKFDRLLEYTKEKVGSRIKRDTDRPDFMSYIMRNDKEGRQMNRAEMEANAEVLIVAGSETTASLLSGATYYLCKNPRALKKVTAEVRDAFDNDQDINTISAKRLDYLLAVLNESLRLYPPGPGSIPRIIVDGDMIAGQWVPPGTTAGVFQWAAYHSSSNFHDCESFVPERWLPDAPAEFRGDSKDVVQPFSTGPRNCIGKNLAYLEMRLILAKILWNFDLSLEQQSRHWANQRAHLVWAKPPLMVRLTPVMRAAAEAA